MKWERVREDVGKISPKTGVVRCLYREQSDTYWSHKSLGDQLIDGY